MNVNGSGRDEMEDSAEDALELVTRTGGLELFSADTRAEVERILAPGQALEPAARTRLVDAARRGVLARSADQRPVERLLFDSRRTANRSIDDVANGAGGDARSLAKVERGDVRITELGADLVASWIETLGLDRQTALSALTTSLATASPSGSYAASPAADLEPQDQDFVAAVRAALGLDNRNAC